jgi:hypothetical protein
MSYIGVPPVTGDFVVLDNITTSATASYTLQRNSANFVPESANHMLVSLNGTIQKPNSSFTISGSTITFSSALTSSDAIDFILVLGNVNAVGVATTVSDNAITNAKTDFVSTSSGAGLQIKGDGTTDGTLQLNCSQNTHGVKIKSPAHSASQSYTLTLPATAPSADKFLQTDGSGNLSFASAGASSEPYFIAGNNTPQNLTNGVSTGINLQTEDVDSNGCFNNTGSATTLNGISVDAYSFAPNVAGYYVLGASVHFQTVADGTSLEMMIMKNQSAAIRNMIHSANGSKDINPHCSLLIYANGSTDDFQLQVRLDGASDNTYYNSNYVRFWGFRVA